MSKVRSIVVWLTPRQAAALQRVASEWVAGHPRYRDADAVFAAQGHIGSALYEAGFDLDVTSGRWIPRDAPR